MNLLLDHAGLHSVLRSLCGRGTSDADVAGLLQFATSLVFANRLIVVQFDSSMIRQRAEHLEALLRPIGLRDNDFEFWSPPPFVYRSAYESAGQDFLDGVIVFDHTATLSDASYITELGPRESEMERQLHAVITAGDSDPILDEYLSAHPASVDYVLHDMFREVPDLLRMIRQIVAADSAWSLSSTRKLIVVLMTLVNEHFAASCEAEYLPAVPRAALVHDANQTLFSRIRDLPGRILQEFEPRDPQLPVVSTYLTNQSHGEPLAVLEAAIELRDKAAPLRCELAEMFRSMAAGSPGQTDRAIDQWNKLCTTFEGALGGSAPRLRDAIIFIKFLGLPILPWPKLEMLDWLEHRRARRKALAITNIARRTWSQGANHRATQRLRSRCLLRFASLEHSRTRP